MAANPFIGIFRTKEEAFYFKNSQINTQYAFEGVQLLPNNESSYIQLTETTSGLVIEDWQVNVVDLCNETTTDITDYFTVESTTTDDDGSPQLYWSLTSVPYDFGYNLIYLEITQSEGETFYTNPFMITDVESEKTTQCHYKAIDDDYYQSIGLRFWFKDEGLQSELVTYTELSTNNIVTQSVASTDLYYFETERIPRSLCINIVKMLSSGVLYLDNIRGYLVEIPDFNDRISQENFTYINFTISPNSDDTYSGLADYSDTFYSTDYDV